VAANVQLALTKMGRATLNGVDGLFAYFDITNASSSEVRLSGWKHDGVLWIEYPNMHLQVHQETWESVVPLLGSFTTSGPDEITVRPGGSAAIAARADFGAPPEAKRRRLLIRLVNGKCVVSREFVVTSNR
jgi:hypothetical protein